LLSGGIVGGWRGSFVRFSRGDLLALGLLLVLHYPGLGDQGRVLAADLPSAEGHERPDDGEELVGGGVEQLPPRWHRPGHRPLQSTEREVDTSGGDDVAGVVAVETKAEAVQEKAPCGLGHRLVKLEGLCEEQEETLGMLDVKNETQRCQELTLAFHEELQSAGVLPVPGGVLQQRGLWVAVHQLEHVVGHRHCHPHEDPDVPTHRRGTGVLQLACQHERGGDHVADVVVLNGPFAIEAVEQNGGTSEHRGLELH
jgi:hypothetical protein